MERQITFDFGAYGSLTEDLFFVAESANQGFKCGWIEGVMYEMAPFTYGDFFKQRRRWLLVSCKRNIWN